MTPLGLPRARNAICSLGHEVGQSIAVGSKSRQRAVSVARDVKRGACAMLAPLAATCRFRCGSAGRARDFGGGRGWRAGVSSRGAAAGTTRLLCVAMDGKSEFGSVRVMMRLCCVGACCCLSACLSRGTMSSPLMQGPPSGTCLVLSH